MTGAELTKTLHATRPALPVILATGYGNRVDLKGFGDARILQKPFSDSALIESIIALLN
jgi:FixJ family two-component response regulator